MLLFSAWLPLVSDQYRMISRLRSSIDRPQTRRGLHTWRHPQQKLQVMGVFRGAM